MDLITSLYNCFERHLMDFEILEESHECFVTKVLEDYILELGGRGVSLGTFAEDIYEELQQEVTEMLLKTTYGHYDLDAFRARLRELHQNAA